MITKYRYTVSSIFLVICMLSHQLIFASTHQPILLYDKQKIKSNSNNRITALALSHDEQFLACAKGNKISVRNAQTTQEIITFESTSPTPIHTLKINNNITVSQAENHRIEIWDFSQAKESGVNRSCHIPCKKTKASITDPTPGGMITAFAIARNTDDVVLAYSTRLATWRAGKEIQVKEHCEDIDMLLLKMNLLHKYPLSFQTSLNHSFLQKVTQYRKNLDQKLVKEHATVACLNDTLALSAADKSISLWLLSSGKRLTQMHVDKQVDALALSNTGETLVIGLEDGSVEILRLKQTPPIALTSRSSAYNPSIITTPIRTPTPDPHAQDHQ